MGLTRQLAMYGPNTVQTFFLLSVVALSNEILKVPTLARAGLEHHRSGGVD